MPEGDVADAQTASGDLSTIPLVAVGASAGGLEPLEAFFQHAAEDNGWCYVVIQHLSPDYKSMMDELLGRRTKLKIRHIEDGVQIAPNTVFLNRPNTISELVEGVFRTRPYSDNGNLPHLPIDALFASLVSRDMTRTAAVVLSGSGADGSRGAQTLHAAGGTVIVQSPAEAAFPSMPRSVLTSGSVDRVSDASDIPGVLSDLFRQGPRTPLAPDVTAEEITRAMLRLLEKHHHLDFSPYKPVNVQRRIVRRQHLRGLDSMDQYLELLENDATAVDELYQDLLIGVTQFYRDPEAMAVLRAQALDRIVRQPAEDDTLRVWVPGCASGEEAYTIGIELSEALNHAGSQRNFRIIATDVHRRSIELASAGVFGEQAMQKVPARLRERYFEFHRDQYVVVPALRQRIIFSVHDALTDPPFLNLDLISCRNLLIYLTEEAQARVISMFLFGLRKDGYLFLGPSETLGQLTDEFESVNARWRLFQKASSRRLVDRSVLSVGVSRASRPDKRETEDRDIARRYSPALREVAETRNRDTLIKSYDALLKRYAPSSILITSKGDVLSWFGAATAFIDTMNNLADWTVEEIVHRDLHFAINVGMEKLRTGDLESLTRKVDVDFGGGRIQPCTITMEPLDQFSKPRLMLATIRLEGPDTGHAGEEPKPLVDLSEASEDAVLLAGRIQELERDLKLTEETLQHVTERLEASGEELQASNEELQASNEELQASNEELQSSNEELHAVNEELISVSSEHERKIELLSSLNRETEHLLRKLGVGVIFLDPELRIRRFSALIGENFQMESHDVDRNLRVIGPRLPFTDLVELTGRVLETGTSSCAEGTYDGREMMVEVYPVNYTEEAATIDGVVAIFHGIHAG
ncbi:Chemotaxis protein methyltransferase CheR [Rhodovulum sp. P5]|uniref:CheR family methyltransferase n=1 Tax=Rhodovulum sp. P5 TaxID=1564506 RepID=UPI0009C1CD11|nr:CheR family methyltransferase [Rhodovulum sp. P5]ARE40996.1 Chemotaxis protein methyltransferase CheR [Rhodovulum sp. P5]